LADSLKGRRWPSIRYGHLRYGITDQKTPKADAQKEAQEDAEAHSLGTPL
jgi:hypothetical protein